MSKNRRKKYPGATITFEVYGICILILSVITLAGQGPIPGMGSVGRALNYICLFLAGKLYYVLPIIAIYVGLFVMIKRQWPKGWSYKKTGLLLIFLAVLGLWSVGMFQQLYPESGATTGNIFSQPYENLKEYVFGEQKEDDQFLSDLGGGMIGAFMFGSLNLFFDATGAKLILFALLAIGFLYLTGWSYVEIGAKVKRLFAQVGSRGKNEWKEISAGLKKKKLKRQAVVSAEIEEEEEDEELHSIYPLTGEIDEETYNPQAARKTKKRFGFFDLIRPSKAEPDDFPKAGDETDLPLEDVSAQESSGVPVRPESEQVILVRDFHEHEDGFELPSESSASAAHTLSAEAGPESLQVDDPSNEAAQAGSTKPEAKVRAPYKLPPFHLLSKPVGAGKSGGSTDFKANARKLETTLESFGVRAKVMEVVRGPSVTRYEIMPDVGVKVSRIVSLTDDIALALAAKDIRMEAPIPGKSAIGIEVPNTEVSVVTMREVMESSSFHESSSKLSVVLGRDISGQPIVGNLAKMPHLLVAGATGSGKSVCINAIITSVLYKARPDEVKFLMIDPKMVELNVYNGIPHLLAPVVTDPRRASLALKKVVVEMEKRYELFSKSATRNIEGYNALAAEKNLEKLPFIVVIVDELADLMMVAAGDVEDAITRLAQMARAAGIHLIIATQRPSVDVITGVIKANIPSRIAFGVSSQVDSRTILDAVGAEKLLGRGDMLYLPVGESKPLRVQGAFLSDREVESVVNYVRSQEKAEYREELVPEVEEQGEMGDEFMDELFDQAAQIVLEAKQASVSLLQRRLRIGYTRAARLIDSMEAHGIIGPYEGSKPREVLMSLEQFHHTRVSS